MISGSEAGHLPGEACGAVGGLEDVDAGAESGSIDVELSVAGRGGGHGAALEVVERHLERGGTGHRHGVTERSVST